MNGGHARANYSDASESAARWRDSIRANHVCFGKKFLMVLFWMKPRSRYELATGLAARKSRHDVNGGSHASNLFRCGRKCCSVVRLDKSEPRLSRQAVRYFSALNEALFRIRVSNGSASEEIVIWVEREQVIRVRSKVRLGGAGIVSFG